MVDIWIFQKLDVQEILDDQDEQFGSKRVLFAANFFQIGKQYHTLWQDSECEHGMSQYLHLKNGREMLQSFITFKIIKYCHRCQGNFMGAQEKWTTCTAFSKH